MSISAMMMVQAAEARRRRDERGRYMEGGQEMHQHPGEMTMAYSHIEDDEGEAMRGRVRRPRMAYERQPEKQDRRRNEMGGEGYYVWDNANQPYMPPERYGQPVPHQNVTDMRDYRTRSHMGEHAEMPHHDKGMIGFGGQDAHGKKLTKEQAEKWVKHMRSDKHRGEMWTMEDAKRLAKPYGIEDGQELLDFYAALNMVYSDFSKVGEAFDVDDEEYYAALACAYLYDSDGLPPSQKIAYHYKYLVPHAEED